MTGAEKVNEFLNEAGVWYFLTTDGNRPKGRPFRFHMLRDDKVYFGTGTFKNCVSADGSKQSCRGSCRPGKRIPSLRWGRGV